MDSKNKPWVVIGYIDAYGAIHHKPVTQYAVDSTHAHNFPMQTHKLWRFIISEWQLENSVLSKDNLTKAEVDDLYAFLRKHYTPPNWFLQGEEWEALGRPRSGKAYEKHCRKWDKIMNIK